MLHVVVWVEFVPVTYFVGIGYSCFTLELFVFPLRFRYLNIFCYIFILYLLSVIPGCACMVLWYICH